MKKVKLWRYIAFIDESRSDVVEIGFSQAERVTCNTLCYGMVGVNWKIAFPRVNQVKRVKNSPFNT